jgi:hypothetical protein
MDCKSVDFTDTSIKKQVYVHSLYELINHKLWVQKLVNHEPFEERDTVLREIRRKLNSYKSQDKLKHKFNKDEHVSLGDVLRMMDESKLTCYYCKRDLCIFHSKKRVGHQWSLERLNNNLGHYTTNTCISCLQCNLQRRTDNYEYFKLGKSMVVNKME